MLIISCEFVCCCYLFDCGFCSANGCCGVWVCVVWLVADIVLICYVRGLFVVIAFDCFN